MASSSPYIESIAPKLKTRFEACESSPGNEEKEKVRTVYQERL